MVSKCASLVLFLTVLTRTIIIHCVPVNNIKFSSSNNDDNIIENDFPRKTETENPVPVIKSDISMQEFEKRLTDFLDWYYETHVRPKTYHVHQHKQLNHIQDAHKSSDEEEIVDPHDLMQADQPATMKNFAFDDEETEGLQKQQEFDQFSPLHVNLTSIVNITKLSDEDRYDQAVRERNKETWIKLIQDNILRITGRVNGTMPNNGEERDISALNITQYMQTIQPLINVDDEFVTEKIRSYYPSCEIPKNTDQEVWNDENTMNLYFNVDHTSEDNGATIATATLRLYRLPQESTSAATNLDTSCENTFATPDEKLLRISIYWYTKSLKKHRVKRRLSDSKVIGETAKWVELSVRPATKAWTKGGKNLGLAILVEDQDGTVLKADKFFKGASCTVGTSTPKPIPTVIVDAARRANELERGNSNAGGNSTTALYNHVSLLPTIDICTLEYPLNMSSYGTAEIHNLRKCDLKKLHGQSHNRATDNPAALTNSFIPSNRHIRHQRQHLQEIEDPRSSFVGKKVVFTHEQLRDYNERLAQNNLTNINR